MDLPAAFPPFGLRIDAENLVLRPVTDDLLPALIDVAMAGIHPPDWMPFGAAWTDAPREHLPINIAQWHWATRSNWRREDWSLNFVVECDGQIVGTQGFATRDYLVTRTGETGSWLGMAHHGRGIGTRMRQAICAFVFDELDADEITSGAFEDNPQSLRVSEKVGYRHDGTSRHTRRGQLAINRRLLLTRDAFNRGTPIQVTGGDEFRAFIGLDRA